jgi:hypothetical protein
MIDFRTVADVFADDGVFPSWCSTTKLDQARNTTSRRVVCFVLLILSCVVMLPW